MKKAAFTLVESLVSLLIVSGIGMAAVLFVSSYMKNTYERDRQEQAVISNVKIIEELKAEVETLPQLYGFIAGKEIKVSAVGVGEIALNPDGTYAVVTDESYGFSEQVECDVPKLFRIEVGGGVPNSKITAVVMLK